jgi:ParB/RepB/Spo0J family partition protein
MPNCWITFAAAGTAEASAIMTEEKKQLKLETWPVDRLIPFARNARTHSKKQVGEIAGSIKAFGFANPILVSPEGDIIAGHGRLAAAQLLGLEQVPVIVVSGLTEMERRQLVLADNRIALNAGWNAEMLRSELKDLSALGAHLAKLGFTKAELSRAVSTTRGGLTDEDRTPDLSAKVVARPGDIWCAGCHRIACGDSTDPQVVRAVLDDARPGLMVTDPPYGVEYDPEWRHEAGINTSKRTGRVLNDGRADLGRGMGEFSGRDRLRLACRSIRNDRRRQPGAPWLPDTRANRLGQGKTSSWARRLSLATRALLVRSAHQRKLDGRSQTDHPLVDQQRKPGR